MGGGTCSPFLVLFVVPSLPASHKFLFRVFPCPRSFWSGRPVFGTCFHPRAAISLTHHHCPVQPHMCNVLNVGKKKTRKQGARASISGTVTASAHGAAPHMLSRRVPIHHRRVRLTTAAVIQPHKRGYRSTGGRTPSGVARATHLRRVSFRSGSPSAPVEPILRSSWVPTLRRQPPTTAAESPPLAGSGRPPCAA